ncbi:MAG TPA: PAS domain-containing protein, partial [Trichocoleus sp.]
MSVTPKDWTAPSPTNPDLLELALNIVADAVVWTDTQQRVLGCNAAFEQLVKATRTLAVGQTLSRLLSLEPLQCALQRR